MAATASPILRYHYGVNIWLESKLIYPSRVVPVLSKYFLSVSATNFSFQLCWLNSIVLQEGWWLIIFKHTGKRNAPAFSCSFRRQCFVCFGLFGKSMNSSGSLDAGQGHRPIGRTREPSGIIPVWNRRAVRETSNFCYTVFIFSK